MKVYLDSRDIWIGYFRSDTHHYVCPLPTVVFRWRRRFDLVAHIYRAREFSARTFGPGARSKGVVAHIRKELAEIEAAPADLSEWIDVMILAIDGAWRAGHEPEAIVAALVAKQDRNEARTWPDWRGRSEDEPIEHDRSAETQGGAS